MITFTVYGEPVAQGRPKFTTISGHAKAYDPEKSANYKSIVRYAASKVRPEKPLEGPLQLTVIAYKSIPKSFSNKKRNLAIDGEIKPITKPDIDNVIKGIKDALKGVIWNDDSQVVELLGVKRYSDVPRVEINIKAV
jgi:Holliday junction resolvase RusA-like endonuclease